MNDKVQVVVVIALLIATYGMWGYVGLFGCSLVIITVAEYIKGD